MSLLFLVSCFGANEPASPLPVPEPTPEPAPVAPVSIPMAATGVLVQRDDGFHVVFPVEEVPGFDREFETRPDDAYEALRPAPTSVEGELVLFDAHGEIGHLPAPPIETRFWCENDGGTQFRPEGRLSELPTLSRPLEVLPDGEGIVAFVRVGVGTQSPGTGLPTEGRVRFEQSVRRLGDLDGDGIPDASLVGWPDEATCENGHLALVTVRHDISQLRCCGP